MYDYIYLSNFVELDVILCCPLATVEVCFVALLWYSPAYCYLIIYVCVCFFVVLADIIIDVDVWYTQKTQLTALHDGSSTTVMLMLHH